MVVDLSYFISKLIKEIPLFWLIILLIALAMKGQHLFLIILKRTRCWKFYAAIVHAIIIWIHDRAAEILY